MTHPELAEYRRRLDRALMMPISYPIQGGGVCEPTVRKEVYEAARKLSRIIEELDEVGIMHPQMEGGALRNALRDKIIKAILEEQ